MAVHTKLEICNQQDDIIRCYQTKRFTGAKNMEVIEGFILKKYKNSGAPFDIKIFDQHHGYVTLDEDYLEEYTPFDTEKMNATTVQPTNSSEIKVILRITLPDHVLYSIVDQQYMPAPEEVSETVVKQNKQIQRIKDVVAILDIPKHPIHLCANAKMGFVAGYNVNKEQRDQYISDYTNVRTGASTGKPAMTQGQKGAANKYKSVLPRFKVYHDDIKNNVSHIWTLLVFIVLDVCQSGKRSLYYHPGRIFVKKDKVTDQWNPYEIPITMDDWIDGMEMELELPVVAIEGAKKNPSAPLHLVCHVEDIDASELSDSSGNYRKSRWALVIRKDRIIQWETLVLSDEMIYIRKNVPADVINSLDVAINTTSTSLKRRRSQKPQTTSNQRSKRTKTQRVENHSSMINLPTNNNNSSLLLNQSLPIYYGDSQIGAFTRQTMSNMLTVDSEDAINSTEIKNLIESFINIENSFEDSTETRNLIGDLTETGNLYGNSTNQTNTTPNRFDVFGNMNMNDDVLVNGDPCLNITASFDIDSPIP